MKKLKFILLVAISWITGYAQQYVPFPTENAQWNVFYASSLNDAPMDTTLLQYSLQGDTIINTTIYKKVCRNVGTIAHPVYKGIGGLREQDKRIYYNGTGYSTNNFYQESYDHILYDFNKNVGDTVWYDELRFGKSSIDYIIYHIDSIQTGDKFRKRYTILNPCDAKYNVTSNAEYIIEGIGNVQQGIFGRITPIPTCSMCHLEWHFVCFSQNGESIYKNPEFRDCNSVSKVYDDLANITNRTTVTVSPNPLTNTSIIKWDTDGNDSFSTIIISDIFGRTIRTIDVSGKSETTIDRRDFVKGIYLVKFHPFSKSVFKIVVQ